MPLQGIYIPKLGKISVKFSVLGPINLSLFVAPMGVKFGMEVHSSMPNFTSIGATCHPCGTKNLKISL